MESKQCQGLMEFRQEYKDETNIYVCNSCKRKIEPKDLESEKCKNNTN